MRPGGVPGRSLSVAAAQPPCVPGDVAANVAAHGRAVHDAGSRLVVFPELSLTGYVLDSGPLRPDDPALQPLVDACAATGSVALVGAPVLDDAGRPTIATLRVDGAGVGLAYRKTFLGGREPEHVTPGEGPVAIDVDGWRIGLGICKDTGTAAHVAGTAALGGTSTPPAWSTGPTSSPSRTPGAAASPPRAPGTWSSPAPPDRWVRSTRGRRAPRRCGPLTARSWPGPARSPATSSARPSSPDDGRAQRGLLGAGCSSASRVWLPSPAPSCR